MISIYYNGLTLKDCVVRRFQQDVVKDDSNTDVMYSRFIITVEATVIEQQYQDVNDPMEDGYPRNVFVRTPTRQNLKGSLQQVFELLSENRKDFWMVLGGQTPGDDDFDREETLVIASGTLGDPEDETDTMPVNPRYPQDPPDGQGSVHRYQVVDVENGPQTEDIAIEQIFGGKSARLSVTFKIARSFCESYSEENQPLYVNHPDAKHGAILNNRWQMTETKNESWQTERTIEGTLRSRHADEFAQTMRYAVLPPLMEGYQRVAQRFATDAANNVMRYVIIDRQRYASPPAPAIDWSATHTESTTMNGAVQTAAFTIRLTGNQGVDKKELIGAAGNVMALRIKDIQNQSGESKFQSVIENLSIMDQLERPEIRLDAQVRYTTAEYTWLSMRVRDMCGGRGGNLVGVNGLKNYDPLNWPIPRAYDSNSPVGMFQSYLQRPCTVWHGMVQDQRYPPQGGTDAPDEQQYSTPEDTFSYELPDNLPEDDYAWMRPSTNNDGSVADMDPKLDIYRFPYTRYEIATSWETSTGVMHLPISSFTASSTGSPNEPLEDTSVAVKLNPGLTRCFYEIEAVRTGRYPTIPPLAETIDDQDNQATWNLLNHEITMRPPTVTADGNTRRFGIALKLIYGGSRPVSQYSFLNPGALPINLIGASDNSSTIGLPEITDGTNHIIDGAPPSDDSENA